ncbi:MAG: porin family protein [Bacteroidia bacterium]
MKKITLSILALTLISLSASSQDESTMDVRTAVHAGVKIGINRANVYDSKTEEFDAEPKLGFAGGAFISIPIGRYLGVQPEVLFSQKGFNGKGRFAGSNYDLKRTTNHLDIPLYFAVKPSPFLTIMAGPQFSYLLSKKDVFTNNQFTIEQEQDFNTENIKKNILGAAIGIDINVKYVVFGLRANWDLQQNLGDGDSVSPRYKNQWIQASIGVRM